MPLASLLLLDALPILMVAWPVASRLTVMSLHTAAGSVASFTVTVAMHVATLLLLSVTVRVTVFGPTLAQVRPDELTSEVLTPDHFLFRLSTCTQVIVT